MISLNQLKPKRNDSALGTQDAMSIFAAKRSYRFNYAARRENSTDPELRPLAFWK